MPENKVKAYVLPADADAVMSSDAVTFPAIPGVWVKGEPVGVDQLGIDPNDSDALQAFDDRLAELELPIVEAGTVERSFGPGETPSSADLPGETMAVKERVDVVEAEEVLSQRAADVIAGLAELSDDAVQMIVDTDPRVTVRRAAEEELERRATPDEEEVE